MFQAFFGFMENRNTKIFKTLIISYLMDHVQKLWRGQKIIRYLCFELIDRCTIHLKP